VPPSSGQLNRMERTEESQTGYPEEQPAEVADHPQAPTEDTPQRKGGQAERKHPGTENEDEGTATGNPNSAG
jgi:hypothetical protein